MGSPLSYLEAGVHATLLACATLAYLRHMKVPVREWPLVLFLFGGATAVGAGYLASCVNVLGQVSVYAVASLIALAGVLGLHRLSFVEAVPAMPSAQAVPLLTFAPLGSSRVRRALLGALLVTFALAFVCQLALAFGVYPDNGDSLNYRLPRVFWYIGHGNLLHPFEVQDLRVMYYPLNGILLNIPTALYGLPGTFFTLPFLLSWLVVALATYLIARDMGAPRLWAVASAWLVALTPSVFVQSTSTNDEILAGAACLAALFFSLRWVFTQRGAYFFLAALGVGLSLGTKLHIVFLIPSAVIACAAIVAEQRRHKLASLVKVRWPSRRVIAASAFVFLITGPLFLILNEVSSGHFYKMDDVVGHVLNAGVSLWGTIQNLVLYLAQLIVAPIPDLFFWIPLAQRIDFYSALNAASNPFFASFISDDPRFYLLQYRFTGLLSQTAPFMLETTLWPGVIWLLWPLQLWGVRQMDRPWRWLWLAFASVPLVWLVLWAILMRYMEGIQIYLTFFLIGAAPAMVLCFVHHQNRAWSKVRWGLMAVVFVTNFVISGSLLFRHLQRNLPMLAAASTWPVDIHQPDRPIIDEIKKASKIQIVTTHGRADYFSYMHYNPEAYYLRPDFPLSPDPEAFHLFAIPKGFYEQFGYGFIPVQVPAKMTPGLTFLGQAFGPGVHDVFGQGNAVEKRWPSQSGYILLAVLVQGAARGAQIILHDTVLGLDPADDLEFRCSLRTDEDVVVFEKDWSDQPAFRTPVSEVAPLHLRVSVRAKRDQQSVTTEFPLQRGQTIIGF